MARKSKEYAFRDGSRVSGNLDPQAIGESLLSISHREPLTPEAVLKEAKKKRSPLHKAFEWDDSSAAEEWRKQQARQLIRAVVVIEDSGENRPFFYHIEIDDVREYKAVDAVVQHEDWLAAATRELKAKVTAAQKSLADLEAAVKANGGKGRRALARVRKPLDQAAEALAKV